MEEHKKIVYILGSGRSGTTILGTVLGASSEYLHIGEINKFYEYRGQPRGIGVKDNDFQFYKNIYDSLENKNENCTRSIEYHSSFPKLLIGLFSTRKRQLYKLLQEQLFKKIFQISGVNLLIDSSKYAGRLMALESFTDYDIHIVYIVRDPVKYRKTVAKKDVEQPSQGFLRALIYYFVSNLLCSISYNKSQNKKVKISFEGFLNHPIETLEHIENKLNISLSESKRKILDNEPLSTERIFEGNRIRLQKQIRFKTSEIKPNEKNYKNKIMQIINNRHYKFDK